MLTRIMKKNPVVTALAMLLLIEVCSVVFVESAVVKAPISDEALVGEEPSVNQAPLRISEIDGPRIDDVAAAVVIEPMIWPLELWVFLFWVYIALLVYNFSATFRRVTSPQWGWELSYTFIILFAWYVLDDAGTYVWFPLIIIKSGLIIFALYAYLLERRLSRPHVHS